MKTYEYSAEAETEIEEIIGKLSAYSPLLASKWADGLDKKCSILAKFPKLGRIRKDLIPDMYMLPLKKYLIFYDITTTGIVVLHVVDARRDVPSLYR